MFCGADPFGGGPFFMLVFIKKQTKWEIYALFLYF